MISHVKFVSIPTRDQDRALKFWTERVGFRVLTDQPFDDKQRWIELRIGSSETRFVLFMFDEQGFQSALMNVSCSPGRGSLSASTYSKRPRGPMSSVTR